jgi:hypothetical protein
MKVENGMLVLVTFIEKFGVVEKELERTNVTREEDKQWIVRIEGGRYTYLAENLIPLLPISKNEREYPINKIVANHRDEIIAILLSQVAFLSKQVSEIYQQLRHCLTTTKLAVAH